MHALAIHTLRNRYRLHGAQPDALRERLARVLGEVLDEGLEAVLAQAGLPQDEHICVRRVRAPVHLSAAQSDARLVLDWSGALAAAIELSIASGGPAVVRYRSRRHALVDFALGVAARDLSRAWAWRQLELLSAGAAASLGSAEHALVDALEGDGAAVVPVLMALASAARLRALSASWTAPDWRRLARAALTAHGLPAQLADAISDDAASTGSGETPTDRAAPAPSLAVRVQRALERSTLARLLDPAPPDQLRARTLFVLLAGDPALLRAAGTGASALLASVRHVPIEMQREPSDTDASKRSDARPEGREGVRRARDRATWTPDVPAQQQSDAGETRSPKQRGDTHRAQTADGSVSAARTHRPAVREDEQPVTRAPASPREELRPALPDAPLDAQSLRALEANDAPHPAAAQPPEPDLRQRGHTQWGGLLFLLWLVEPCAIQELAAQPPLAARSLRWVLHQLALRLAPAAPNDPAALAFAGLLPGALPPALEDPPPAAEEEAAIEDCRDRVIAALRMRLDTGEGTDAQVLRQVCERRGEIVADPGWIELHLSLDEVSTSIRRCGLDLNLDFLPWLGVVVRFVYA